MFKRDPMPGISLPNPTGFPMGLTAKRPPHPNPFDPEAFLRDTPWQEHDHPPVVMQAEPRKDLEFDASKCIVLVPVARFIELDCDHCLRGLESLGFRVDRLKGASAIDMTRSVQATRALDAGFEQILFVDSDMMFDPNDAVRLFRSPEPVIGAVYAAKRLAKEGKGGQINVDYAPGVGTVRYGKWADGLKYPVNGLGAGFLRIRTDVLKKMADFFNMPRCQMGGDRAYPFFMPFYSRVFNEDVPRYFCEDYAFCWRCSMAGIHPYADTSIRTYHIGDYPYSWEEARGDYIPREMNLEAPARTTKE